MKSTLLISFVIFTISHSGFSQKISYQYPTYLFDYTDDIRSEVLYKETIEDFDTTTINSEYQIQSEPVQIRNYIDGKIIESKNLTNNSNYYYSYDSLGNIISYEREKNNTKILVYTHKLNHDEFKIETYENQFLKGELFFDKENRYICRTHYSPNTTRKNSSKTNYTYNNSGIEKEEYYQDDNLTLTINYFYKAGRLSHKKSYDKDNSLIKEEIITYFPSKKETITLVHRDSKSTNTSSIQSPKRSRKINFLMKMAIK